MRWVWDEEKNGANEKKHKIGFEAALYVFNDPMIVSRLDRRSHHEERWQTIGEVDGSVVFVVHTLDENEEGGRIISARKATKQERRAYEEGHFEEF